MPRKKRLALMGAALALASTGVTISIAGVASASGSPTVSTNVSGSYSDGETISVWGSGFPTPATDPSGIEILECSDPGGSAANLPADDSSCDGSTLNPLTIPTDSAGKFSGTYTISALSTSGGSNIDCDASDPCVLWVGEDYAADFSDSAHVAFSAPFLVVGSPSTPNITSASSASFSQGPSHSFQFAATGASGGSYAENGALPSGITLSSSGKLSGATGAAAGSYPLNVTVSVPGSDGTRPGATQMFTLTVTSAAAPAIVASAPPAATIGKSYSYTLKAVGSVTQPLKWKAAGKLPKGLKLNKSTGQITGVPVASKHTKYGAYPFTASFKDHSKPKKSASANLSITLDAAS